MRIITVRTRRGKRSHAITYGAEAPRVALCGVDCDGATIVDTPLDCQRCMEKHHGR